MKLRKLIEEYLNEAKLMQIATAKSDQPWACTVYFAYDNQLNLYWISKPTTRHSQEIRSNNKVAGAIVLPHSSGANVRGIQFEGSAKELTTKEDVIVGMKYYAYRFKMGPERMNEILNKTDEHVCYKITPSTYVLFDESNFPNNPRQVYKIDG